MPTLQACTALFWRKLLATWALLEKWSFAHDILFRQCIRSLPMLREEMQNARVSTCASFAESTTTQTTNSSSTEATPSSVLLSLPKRNYLNTQAGCKSDQHRSHFKSPLGVWRILAELMYDAVVQLRNLTYASPRHYKFCWYCTHAHRQTSPDQTLNIESRISIATIKYSSFAMYTHRFTR